MYVHVHVHVHVHVYVPGPAVGPSSGGTLRVTITY